LRPRSIVLLTVMAALAVFSIVQDRVTAAGANRYTALQRAALAGQGPSVTVDEIMRPAITKSVHQGLLCAGGVIGVGLTIATVVARKGGPV